MQTRSPCHSPRTIWHSPSAVGIHLAVVGLALALRSSRRLQKAESTDSEKGLVSYASHSNLQQILNDLGSARKDPRLRFVLLVKQKLAQTVRRLAIRHALERAPWPAATGQPHDRCEASVAMKMRVHARVAALSPLALCASGETMSHRQLRTSRTLGTAASSTSVL